MDRFVSVYVGSGQPLRVVEEQLTAAGIPFLSENVDERFLRGSAAEGQGEHRLCAIRVPAEAASFRAEEIARAVAAGTEVQEGDPAAIAEAEEDFDVRACPACRYYFHETYLTCPGCGAELVPAVECFVADQLEPDLVIVAHGDEEVVVAIKSRLVAAGFRPEAWEIEGWPAAVVQLTWRELTDRTKEAEAILRASHA